jgi:hypothetical protein
MSGHFRHHGLALVIALIAGTILATGPPFWWKYLHHSKAPTGSPAGVLRFAGGCAPFQIFAQNRWEPYGAAVRTGPDVRRKQISNFDGNHSIAVDGWLHGSVAYPTNRPPWNSDIWFHLADNSGWVSYAGVRGVPTIHDPTGLSPDGGEPAPTLAKCQGAAQ